MPAPPKNRPFSYYLMIAIFSVILVVVVAGISVNYINMSRNYQENAGRLATVTESYINTSFDQIDTALKIYDNTYNDKMEAAFGVVLEEYNQSGGDPSRMNLTNTKQEIEGLDIYFINSSGVIEYSTVNNDLGLDFSVIYPDFYDYLMDIWYKPGFYPDRVVMEWNNGTYTKYAYMPTPDHKYIMELGMISEKFRSERKTLKYSEVINEVQSFNPYVESVRLWSLADKVEHYNESSDGDHKASESESRILDQIKGERKSLVFVDASAGKTTKWLLVDMKDPDYGSDMSLVAELTYNDAMILQDLNNLTMVHLLVGLIALLIGGVFALTLSRRLTRPIQQITDDVNLIALGDLDHKITPTRGREFEVLEGSINAMVGSLKGTIQKLQESEENLKASEEAFRTLWESDLDGTLILDWEGKVLFANRAAAQLVGMGPAEEIVGRSVLDFLAPESRVRALHNLSLVQQGRGGALTEYRLETQDSQVKYVESLSSLIHFRGADADLVSLRNITERKRAEMALRESEERFRAIYEDNPSMYFIVDAEGIVVSVNLFGAEQLGYTGEELEGHSVLDVFYPDDKEAVQRQLADILKNFGQIAHWVFRKVRKDGSVLWVKETARAVRGTDGKPIVLVVCEDITETKRAEEMIRRLNEELEERVAARTAELAAANRELESFSYSVSHDLRAPLRAIDGYSSMLLQKHQSQLSEEDRKYLQRVRENVGQMALLIDALLDLSRMGRQELKREDLSPREMVEKALENLQAEQGGTRAVIEIGDLPPVYADRAMLQQVFQNLLSNALKFTRNRDVPRVEVGAFRDETGNNVYYVRDNGIGFDMQYAEKVFGVFERLHSGKEFEGSGIGLALVKRIIDRHNGRIWVESEIDKGTTFYFTLPVRPSGR